MSRAKNNRGLPLFERLFSLEPEEFFTVLSQTQGRAGSSPATGHGGRYWAINRRRVLRLIVGRLPEQTPVRERVRRAQLVTKLVSDARIAVQAKGNERTVHETRRAIALARNEATAHLYRCAQDFEDAARGLDAMRSHGRPFARALEERARALGIEAHGDVVESILMAIADAASAVREPIPIDPPIAQKTATPESEFDHLVSSLLEDLIPNRSARARLISALRAEIGLPTSTDKAIEQRLRDR